MDERKTGKGYDREHRGAIRKFKILIGVIMLAVIAAYMLLGLVVLRDDGMQPTYRNGQLVFFLRAGREYKRGEPVCIRLPDGRISIRRVVAVAGDSVEIRNGIAYINGIAERGNYNFTRTDVVPDGMTYPVILRSNEVFVLGDARESALDSRTFGVVHTADLLGHLLGQ